VDTLLLVVRLVFALLFGVAGALKLCEQAELRTTLAAFGVPELVRPMLAFALPLVELCLVRALHGA
jgi:uncharacterized membrane protein YphA (DoxX/SURF4 family)